MRDVVSTLIQCQFAVWIVTFFFPYSTNRMNWMLLIDYNNKLSNKTPLNCPYRRQYTTTFTSEVPLW